MSDAPSSTPGAKPAEASVMEAIVSLCKLSLIHI